jgi:hypothetical protein
VTDQTNEAINAKAAESLTKAFLSLCVQMMPNLDRVEGSAKRPGWKEVTGLEGTVVAPADPNTKFKTWLVEGAADVPFLLSVSHAREGESTISICSFANPSAPPTPIYTALRSLLRLEQPSRVETEGGRKFAYWRTQFAGYEIILSLADNSPVNEPGVDLSAALIEKVK